MTEDITQLSYALDTFYFLIAGVLVMWMAAGFAMLEAGLVRSKNTAEILTKNVVLFAISCTMYLLFSYHLMYSSGAGGFLPSLGFLLGGENTVDQVMGSNGDIYYSNRADFFFQVVFVATAMSIVSGAVAERMKLWAFLAFAVVMTGIIYPTSGYWTWGGGWLSELGFSDYAGSGIVHMAGASAALAGVLVLGPRKGKYGKNGAIYAIPGANLPLATLGTFILWMGWFGFNGGSELMVSNIDSANNMAQVLVNTNAAAAGGVIAALILAKIWFRKADLTMALNGAIAGLVAITADPLSPTGLGATLIGAIGGLLVVASIVALDKLKIDDPVGAISAHGVVGLWGVLAVPITNASASFGVQIIGALAIFLWCFIASLIVWLIIKAAMGVRVSEEEEYEGVDLAECGLEAYPEFASSKT
ncbi:MULTISPECIES: ammonium transporter [Chromohalobacter]|uniref:ammonium transporter n=1 Tax=Chromohalobacter TaxID=42054 RepID=UPI001FFD9FFB|nr:MULTISPECIES: ammonium transporter [Chromohalobacter]MCK2045851.1 ammonium transporter [Chromohalobacter moromii]MCT8469190.1 ammonium transporter [Chromohalobacter canadensis]MCT8472620.1 ammonium transporter [Chromohalobacter canadensis]MCT8500073.1 ammonium transporter [Chromohalobacter canadensis]